MPPFGYDDIPSIGHKVLRHQANLLKYYRIAEFELPKLQGELQTVTELDTLKVLPASRRNRFQRQLLEHENAVLEKVQRKIGKRLEGKTSRIELEQLYWFRPRSTT